MESSSRSVEGRPGLLELILSTGELVPQRPGPTSNLLSFDQTAVTQTPDPNASLSSNIGLGVALGYAGNSIRSSPAFATAGTRRSSTA